MKIVIPSGSGQVGTILARALRQRSDKVVILSRTVSKQSWKAVQWDAGTLGGWADGRQNLKVRRRSLIWPDAV